MRIGEMTAETGVRLPRVEERPAVAPSAKVEVEAQKEPAKQAPPIEIRKIESVTKQIDSFLRSIGRNINFRVDQASGQMIVSVVDANTGEIIRQVPGEDALKLAQSIEQTLSALVDETA